MKKFLQIVFSLALMTAFLAAGLWVGPNARALYSRWFPEPAFVTGDYSALYKDTSKQVVTFTTSTCPACKRARELLAAHRIDYYDFVIDQSAEARTRYEALNEESVPVLFIGDRKIVGARVEVIEEALGRL